MALNTFPCNPYPISTEELNKGNNDALNTRVTALEGDVSDLEEQKANQITIALSFNPETTYNPGDLVYYNGLTYRCTNEHTGEWDADDFAGTTIANELSELKSGLIGLTPNHVVLEIPANTHATYGDAIGAILTAYGTLTADQKQRSFITLNNDIKLVNCSVINGYFGGMALVSSGGSAYIRELLISLAHGKYFYTGADGSTGEETASAQSASIQLCY